MKKSRLLGAVCACLLGFAVTVSNADVVTLNFDLEVTSADFSTFGLRVGDRFTASAVYDTNSIGTPTLIGGSDIATTYFLSGAPNQLMVNLLSGFTFTNYQVMVADDMVGVWPPDLFEIRAPKTDLNGFEKVDFTIDIWSTDTGTLTSEALPTSAFNVLAPEFVRRVGSFGFVHPTNSQVTVGVGFVVTDMSVVPTPPALYLFGSGLLGLVGVARRKS